MDPIKINRECTNLLSDVIDSYKKSQNVQKDLNKANIHRHTSLGNPGGKIYIADYSKFCEEEIRCKHDQQVNRNI